MRQILILILIFLMCNKSFAQKDSVKLNVINIEILGQAGFCSINYERLINLCDVSYIDMSIGTMYYPHSRTTVIVPQLNILLGRNNNFFEMGYAIDQLIFPVETNKRIQSIRIGYRFQDFKNGGFMFRAGFTPFFGLHIFEEEGYPKNSYIIPWIGLTFGYSF